MLIGVAETVMISIASEAGCAIAWFKTRDIKKSLELYASENFIPINECDFRLLSIITSIKSNADSDYVVIRNDLLKEYLKKDRIINEHISFIQNYNIEIFHGSGFLVFSLLGIMILAIVNGLITSIILETFILIRQNFTFF
jgi:hypothetical protein